MPTSRVIEALSKPIQHKKMQIELLARHDQVFVDSHTFVAAAQHSAKADADADGISVPYSELAAPRSNARRIARSNSPLENGLPTKLTA